MFELPYDISCGYFDCSEFAGLTVSPKRKVTKFEIEFYLEDGIATFVDEKEYTIKKWCIQIAKPGQVRYSRLPFKTIYLKFSVNGKIADRLLKVPEYFKCSQPEVICKELNEIIILNEENSKEILLYSHLLSCINQILDDAQLPKKQSSINYEIIYKAKKYIELNYNKSIHLEDIAASVNLSPIYFHNVFNSSCGYSPHEYLIQVRIKEAKKQLWESNADLNLVAENCGFGCQQYFNKIFKKETGISPGKYRKEFQKNYIED